MPAGLSPLYELPWQVTLPDPVFLVNSLVVLALTAGCLLARRRWPAATAVWLAYALTLAPVSGIAQAGPQLVADRYSYLSTLGLALGVGGALALLVTRAASGDIRPSLPKLTIAAVGAWTLGLAGLTWGQVQVWRNDATLWQHVLAIDPVCGKRNIAWAKHLERTGEAEARQDPRLAERLRRRL